jgi:uncharacterized damage-inducible protein DinB
MATKKAASPSLIADAAIGAYATNNRINLYLLHNLADEAWRAKPPEGKGRDAASIVAHIHNVRLMWLKAAGAAEIPSWRALEGALRAALNGDGRIKGFKPDVVSFFAYLVAHDAHHRGQVTMLAGQVGHPLSQSAMFGMWEWGTR